MTSACAESDCLTQSSVNGRKFVVIISINSGLCRNEVTGGLKSGGQLQNDLLCRSLLSLLVANQ